MDVGADAYNEDYSDAAVAEEIAKYRNIVLSACSSLGNLQPNTDESAATNAKMVYVPAKDCLASLKDIKRYIQMDEQGDGKLVLQWLGEWQVLERDIIPIFTITANHILPEQTVSDTDALKTVMMCVELFVFLTWSMESESDEVKMRFIRVLRSYKRAFAKPEVIKCLLAVAVRFVRQKSSVAGDGREDMLVKGILYVFRNVLAIPDPLVSPSSGSLAAQVETHDTLIGVLEDQLAADFFLTLISSSADQPRLKDLRPTLLDIVYYLFYRVPVSALFDQPHHTWFDGPEKNSKAHNKSSRHNNFGGVYAVSTGEGTIMPVFSTREVLRPFANLFKRRAKVDKPKDAADTLSVDLQWRIVDPSSIATLRRIAAVFIESCFNPFILALFEDLRMNGTVVDGFTPRLMYVSAYFVDISLANPAIDLGSTCALVQTHVFGQVMRCASAYVELKHWTGLEPAMYCLQQTLLSLSKMRGAKLDSLADNILSNLFYDGDALDLFVMLCRVYKPRKNTRAFLEQVARLTETFLDTLREYAQTKAGMVVRTKVRRRVPKTHSTMDADMDMDLGVEAEEMDDEDIGDESKLVTQVEEVLVEREFNISRYEAAFAVADVVKSYSHLLSPPSAIEHVFPMLRRIAITHQRPHLFFKKPIMQRLLTLFDDQLTYPNRSEMIDLAAWIFRQYMVVLDSPSLMAHYKAEPLDNRMAMECVMTFLKQSSAGKAVEPVITRNLIELRASTPETKPETKPENRPEEWDEEEEYLAHASSALPLGSTAASMAGAIAEINEDDLDFYGGHGDDFDFDFDSMLNN